MDTTRRFLKPVVAEGKTILAIKSDGPNVVILFSDNTYIVFSSQSPITTDSPADTAFLQSQGVIDEVESAAIAEAKAKVLEGSEMESYLTLKERFAAVDVIK